MTPEEAKDRCIVCAVWSYITKTCLFKYTENFTIKKWKFSDKNSDIFSYFCWKHNLWVLVRTASTKRLNEYRLDEAVLTSTHNLCFWAEIRKIMYIPCKPQFYYIKVGFKGVKIILACFRDDNWYGRYAHQMHVNLFEGHWCGRFASRKHAYIILTPLNPTFI